MRITHTALYPSRKPPLSKKKENKENKRYPTHKQNRRQRTRTLQLRLRRSSSQPARILHPTTLPPILEPQNSLLETARQQDPIGTPHAPHAQCALLVRPSVHRLDEQPLVELDPVAGVKVDGVVEADHHSDFVPSGGRVRQF